MDSTNKTELNSIEIVKITPSVLDKGLVWFEKNMGKIREESHKFSSFWYSNYKKVMVDEKAPLSEFMRQMSDWGYIRTSEVHSPGEVAQRGGIVDLFPINMRNAVRIEFEGNYIEAITPLAEIKNEEPEKELEKVISKEPQIYTKKFTPNKEKAQKNLKSLKPGSYVVHIDHGIAKFKGISQSHDNFKFQISNSKTILNDQISKTEEQKLLELEYAQGDRLLVPVAVADKVSPYIGFGEPHLTRLGGNVWEKTKRKVKEDILKTAKELARIYAKREVADREKYHIDQELASTLAHSFKFDETPDQTTTIEAIEHDLVSKNSPMDRLVCADVGFGKTEVAVRAAGFAVSAGHQVVLIAPTTVLAHQHFKTLKERFGDAKYPAQIEKLTRIEKPSEQKRILKSLKEGGCDIVIGTHRLLQTDVEFKKLGLLIIDEEQRFGVKQKEVFKDKRAELDILSLSATPIPRTLHFALSGLRDISIISTPPSGRLPVETFVKRFSENNIKKAMERELKRGGQVYYLHNRISSLASTVDALKKLVPKARIGYMHAKLPERRLIETIDKFTDGEIDILATTTIMENGLDVGRANTLIVEDATRLGLAQAHQIRGRIGRSDTQAYAYFLHPAKKLKTKAGHRLKALEDTQYLGAGYEIATRDLELRGTGSLLGREQSGSIAKVGFNLYTQLLAEAVEELRQG